MTTNSELNRLRVETAGLALALLSVLEPDQRKTALQILRTADDVGDTNNRLLRAMDEMISIPEESLPEVDHG